MGTLKFMYNGLHLAVQIYAEINRIRRMPKKGRSKRERR